MTTIQEVAVAVVRSGARLVKFNCAQCGSACRRPRRRLRPYKRHFCGAGCQIAYYRAHGDERLRGPVLGAEVVVDGYVMVRVRDGHHLANAKGYAFKHLLVAEDVLGRRLRPGEEVRKRARNRRDVRPEMLDVRWTDPRTGVEAACLLLELAAIEHGEIPSRLTPIAPA